MAEAAPKSGEVKIDVAKLNGSEEQAGRALEALFPEADAEEIEEQEQEISQPADVPTEEAEQEETPAIGEHEEGQSEPEEAPAIEPPHSWSAEEKKVFAQLPPAVQQTVLRRESERDRLISERSQQASETTRRLEAERQQLANDRAQQVAAMQAVLLQLMPEIQRYQTEDWDKLAAERPSEWAVKQQQYQTATTRWNLALQQIGALNQQQQVEAEKQKQTFVGEQRKLLIDKIPELADATKRTAFGKELAKYLTEVSEKEIGELTDHRLVLIARDAMLWRKSAELRKQAQDKRAPLNGQQQQRRMPLRPTPRRGDVQEQVRTRQLGALYETMRKSGGTTQSTADLLAATGIFGEH